MNLLTIFNVGKAYRSYGSEWARVAQWFGWRSTPKSEQWVLRNVNFEVRPGESIGIIGRNGAGKSTLLKIIAGTLQPSEGHVQVNGTMAAILELGMGFNPELTGRANVMHAAGLMGYGVDDIRRLVPEVEQFAELGDYFDQPVRTYSSGMAARLAFSLATARRPDLLIVDEALSVGDDAFRRKCFARIEDYLRSGTSLLLVSHMTEQIRRTCTRAIYLDRHQVVADGMPKEVCAQYEKTMFTGLIEHKNGLLAGERLARLQNNADEWGETLKLKARLISINLFNRQGEEVNLIPSGLDIRIRLNALRYAPIEKLAVSVGIKTPDGVRVYTSVFKNIAISEWRGAPENFVAAIGMKAFLLPGTYFVTVGLFEDNDGPLELIHQLADEAMFRVFRVSDDPSKLEMGMAGLNAEFHLEEN